MNTLNPFEILKASQARRRREKRDLEFGTGYGWAWSAYMIEGLAIQHIESIAMSPYDQASYFDLGARAAVNDIKALGVKPKPLESMSQHGKMQS